VLGTYVLKRCVSVSALSDVFASNVVGLCRDLDVNSEDLTTTEEVPQKKVHQFNYIVGSSGFPGYGIANASGQAKATEEHDQSSNLPAFGEQNAFRVSLWRHGVCFKSFSTH
jgi:hypothetical protein